jgi:hypothetical protein
VALGVDGMNARLEAFAKTFGDLVVEVVQSQNVEDIEDFLDFLDGIAVTVRNAREATQDRVHKLRIAKKWESTN